MILRFSNGRVLSIELGIRELFATLPGGVEIYAWREPRAAFRLRRTRGAIDLDLGRLRLCLARSPRRQETGATPMP